MTGLTSEIVDLTLDSDGSDGVGTSFTKSTTYEGPKRKIKASPSIEKSRNALDNALLSQQLESFSSKEERRRFETFFALIASSPAWGESSSKAAQGPASKTKNQPSPMPGKTGNKLSSGHTNTLPSALVRSLKGPDSAEQAKALNQGSSKEYHAALKTHSKLQVNGLGSNVDAAMRMSEMPEASIDASVRKHKKTKLNHEDVRSTLVKKKKHKNTEHQEPSNPSNLAKKNLDELEYRYHGDSAEKNKSNTSLSFFAQPDSLPTTKSRPTYLQAQTQTGPVSNQLNSASSRSTAYGATTSSIGGVTLISQRKPVPPAIGSTTQSPTRQQKSRQKPPKISKSHHPKGISSGRNLPPSSAKESHITIDEAGAIIWTIPKLHKEPSERRQPSLPSNQPATINPKAKEIANNKERRPSEDQPRISPTSSSSALIHITKKDQDVIAYLNRNGIEYRLRCGSTFEPRIFLLKHDEAVTKRVLGQVEGETFHLTVSDQGELSIARPLLGAQNQPSTSEMAMLSTMGYKKLPSFTAASNTAKLGSENSITILKQKNDITATLLERSPPAKNDKLIHQPAASVHPLDPIKTSSDSLQVRQEQQFEGRRQAAGHIRQSPVLEEDDTTTSRRLSTGTHSNSDSSSENLLRRSKRCRINSGPNSPLFSPSLNEARSLKPASLNMKGAQQHEYTILEGREKTRISLYPSYSRGSLLRLRDIGGPVTLSSRQSLLRLRDSCLDTMIRPWKNWTGASKDIISSAWAPDGMSFVVGSSTDLDLRNQMYNRGNNLLWCDLTQGIIAELDDHKIERLQPEPGSSQSETSLSNVLDSHVFTTISDICYGSDPNRFYTASYDKTIKAWNYSSTNDRPKSIGSIEYQHEVSMLTKCHAASTELLASAQKSNRSAVQVFEWQSSHISTILDTDQTEKHKLIPTGMVWGHSAPGTGSLLAVGYGDESSETTRRSRGDILVWDSKAQTKIIDLVSRFQCVYDIAWHSQMPWLAAATNARSRPYEGLRGAQSNIRFWNPVERPVCIFDLDCPALDINRLLLHPFDSKYVSVGCTDGSIYHYDLRKPQDVLAKLEHGNPIAELKEKVPREIQDYGVNFISWNAAGTLLYSGSSDGKVKQWNPYLNESDAFITDIATFDAGISSGRFSPDFTNLLIGTTKGSVHVLSSAPVTPWSHDDVESLTSTIDEHQSNSWKGKGIEKSERAEDTSFKYLPAAKHSAVAIAVASTTETSEVPLTGIQSTSRT